jgi:hypothetical protein
MVSSTQLAAPDRSPHMPELTHADVRQQVNEIQRLMEQVMQNGQHYGAIPGCGDKPTLLQPGAQKLALAFQFAAKFDVVATDLRGGHREFSVVCDLSSRSTGMFIGQGVGSASTRESRYLYRNSTETLREGLPDDYKERKVEYRKQGLVAKKINDRWFWCKLEKLEHDNPADYYNTVLKIAKKRAFVDAVLTATSASDIFTQDIEDSPELFGADGHDVPTTYDPPPDKSSEPSESSETQPEPHPANAAPDEGPGYKIAKIDKTSGKKKDGGSPWTRWKIQTTCGLTLQTFDTHFGGIAETCYADGYRAEIEFTEKTRGKYTNLVIDSITEVVPGSTGYDLHGIKIESKANNGHQYWIVTAENLPGEEFGVADSRLAEKLDEHAQAGTPCGVRARVVREGSIPRIECLYAVPADAVIPNTDPAAPPWEGEETK